MKITYKFNERTIASPSDIITTKQIHSNICYVITDNSKIDKNNPPQADAIITNIANIKIAVKTADCVPILIYCPKPKIIAAIHAGWKGAKSNIISNAITEIKKLNTNISETKAIIGPSIHQKSYEVAKDFYDNFISEDKNFIEFFQKTNKNKFLFNLPLFVENKLKKEGLQKIENININTYNDSNFYSYRRFCHKLQKENGRNISWIEILNK